MDIIASTFGENGEDIHLLPDPRYGIGFGSTGDEFVGWGDFATRGDKFHSNVTANTLYNGYSYADFLYKFGLMSLTPAIVSGKDDVTLQ